MDDFVKITEEMVYSERWEAKRLPLCDSVDGAFIGEISSFELGLKDALINCESPIEQRMALEMMSIDLLKFYLFYAGRIDVIGVENQAEIEACGNKYRADFLIPVVYKTKDNTIYKTFIVECDGHDYHEKTKEQVAKNNQRERDLKAAGYEVVRFSGSEIHKSPRFCVKDLMRIIAEYYFQL